MIICFRIGSYFKRLSLTAVIPEAVGCESDQECSNNEACDNGDCINPCANSNPCSSNAICFNENHRANCRCPPGFTGDPFSRCVIRKLISKKSKAETLYLVPFSFVYVVKTGECQHDDDCGNNEACIENYCVDPCDSDPCGRNAICKTTNHIPVCRCPENWAGNPHQECFECKQHQYYLFSIFIIHSSIYFTIHSGLPSR